MRNKTFPILASLLLALASPPASAQSPATDAGGKPVLSRPLAEAMTKKARDLFTEGVQAAAQGRLAEARAAFVGADALAPHYSNQCNLGDVELRLGLHVEAATRLRTCSDGLQGDAKATAAERDAASKLLQKAKGNVLEIAIAAPAGTDAPARVSVTIDGMAAGVVPPGLGVFVAAGKHVVQLEAEGYEGGRIEVEGAAGARKEVAPALKKKVAAAPTATATASASVTAAPPAAPRSMVPAYVMGGVGLASAIVGGVLVGSSVSTQADMLADVPVGPDGRPACRRAPEPATNVTAECEAWRVRGSEASMLGNVGIGLFVVAGVAAAGALGYALWPSGSGSRSGTTWRVSPVVSVNGAGTILEGRF